MIRPTSVEILGHHVRILELPPQADDDCKGFSDSSHEILYVSSQLSDGAWESSLLHEVIHYISDELGKDLSEEQTRGLATGLFSSGIRIR